ncbi:Ubiquitin thioesterase otubain-like [Dictyocoela muelleri]|nr:Ubiquitin thioesterase otubain-like [Dictyocoela muelleri]
MNNHNLNDYPQCIKSPENNLKYNFYGIEKQLSAHPDYDKFRDRFETIKKDYTAFVPVKRDGNCFYTSFIYSLCQLLPNETKEFVLQMKQRIVSFNERFEVVDLKPYVYEDFQEMLLNLLDESLEIISRKTEIKDRINKLKRQENCNIHDKDDINEYNYDTEIENYSHDYLKSIQNELSNRKFILKTDKYYEITAYLKMVISTTIQFESYNYAPFIEMDLKEYCKKNVEVFYRMTSHVDIYALSTALNVGVKIESLMNDEPFHIGNNESYVCILHSPSHFEPLIPNK